MWIALALTQRKLGRPEARARDTALAAIDDGHAITAWLGSGDEGWPRCALVEARADLLLLLPLSLFFAAALDGAGS